jgi:hypothetical protein
MARQVAKIAWQDEPEYALRRAVKILAIVAALVLAGFVAYSQIYPTLSEPA